MSDYKVLTYGNPDVSLLIYNIARELGYKAFIPCKKHIKKIEAFYLRNMFGEKVLTFTLTDNITADKQIEVAELIQMLEFVDRMRGFLNDKKKTIFTSSADALSSVFQGIKQQIKYPI